MIGPPAEEIAEKLATGEIRPLTVSLFPLDKGYSVTLPGLNCVDKRTKIFSYRDDYELLQHIENGELPSVLIDLIERFCVGRVFYKNCVACRIEDLRVENASAATPTDEVWYYLRPTANSLNDDLNRLLARVPSSSSSDEERQRLERDFWKFTAENLTYAEPPPGDDVVYGWQSLMPRRAQRYFDRRKRRAVEADRAIGRDLKLTKFLKPSVDRLAKIDDYRLGRLSSGGVPLAGQWKVMLPSTKSALEISEKRRLAAAAHLESEQRIDDAPDRTLVEEYSIEFPATQQTTSDAQTSAAAPSPRYSRTKIVITKRRSDGCHAGELIVERDAAWRPAGGAVLPAVRSNFVVGTELDSRLYVAQYLEMVSEGGRRPLTLTRTAPGKPPQVVSRGAKAAAAISGIPATSLCSGDFLNCA